MIYYKINLEYTRAVHHYHIEEEPITQGIEKRINIGKINDNI